MDWGEIEEALVLVKAGKVGGRGKVTGVELEPLSFLENVDGDDGDKLKGQSAKTIVFGRDLT